LRQYFFPSKELAYLLLALFALTLWRYGVVVSMSDQSVSLYVDEAQYWFWAQQLDFGFYSKPPVIALIIAATTSVCGDGESCIRVGSLILYPLTSLLIYSSASFLFDRRVGLVSALLFATLPAVSLSSLVISTDIALFFFWVLTFYAFIRALASNEWHWWIVVGFAGGMGMESKYTMGIFVFSTIAYLVTSKQFALVKNPRLWAAVIIAFLLWLPNLYWNTQHDWITFVHTAEIAEFEQRLFHWDELGTFLVGQLFVFGPLLFVLFLGISFTKKTKQKALLISFSWMFLGIILLQALFGRANANWAAPAYITASILVATWLLQQHRMGLLIVAIVINLALGALIYHTEIIFNLAGYELNSKTDLRKRLRGWRALGKQYQQIQAQYPKAILLGTDRTILSHLLYHVQPNTVMTWNSEQKIRHHYDLHGLLHQPLNKTFLFVSDKALTKEMQATFQTSVKLKDSLHVQIYPDVVRHYSVYYLENFTGYSTY
jgi:4-amino-4-deoxy-L-arabinose transferase-like glycosyltransferase